MARQFAPSDLSVLDVASIHPEALDENVGLYVDPATPANIIFTSGSTGEPKGVAWSHRGILNKVKNYTADLVLRRSDRHLCLGPCAFSGILKDIFGTLLNGATLLPLDVAQFGLDNLAAYCRQERITIFPTVPTLFRAWGQTLADGEPLPDVRIVRLGGEAATACDLELYRQHFAAGCVLVVGYASTEAGTVAHWTLAKEDRIDEGTLPFGRECDEMEVQLLDESGSEVPPGEVGQIAVRSRNLALGYWQRPDLTEAAFSGHAAGGDLRTYLTGDLAIRRPDGCLVFAGRNDMQVKIRGYRVEIGAVESALRQVPGVREAAVVGEDDHRTGQRLVAYVVPQDQAAIPIFAELRSHLRTRLPDYAVPSFFVPLEMLPLGPNGKVNRRELSRLRTERHAAHRVLVRPRNELEQRLQAIWQQELEVQPIGVTDDFFELGGDSLLATGVMAQIHKEFGKSLPISVLAHEATIAHLAKVIQQRAADHEFNNLVTLQAAGSRPPLYCVHGIGGEVLFLRKLGKHMPDQPLHAFRLQGLEGGEAPWETIEQMATHYVDQLVRMQPQGPYHLCGFSLGGTVAYEMAQQLTASGATVALLAIIDQRNHRPLQGRRWTADAVTALLGNIRWWIWDDFLSKSPAQWWRRLAVKSGALARSLAALVSLRSARADIRNSFDLAQVPDHYRRLLELNFRACRHYAPRPIPGRITVIRARAQALLRLQGSDLGWRGFADELEFRSVPGNHDNLFEEPYVQAVAAELGRCLDRVAIPSRACL